MPRLVLLTTAIATAVVHRCSLVFRQGRQRSDDRDIRLDAAIESDFSVPGWNPHSISTSIRFHTPRRADYADAGNGGRPSVLAENSDHFRRRSTDEGHHVVLLGSVRCRVASVCPGVADRPMSHAFPELHLWSIRTNRTARGSRGLLLRPATEPPPRPTNKAPRDSPSPGPSTATRPTAFP